MQKKLRIAITGSSGKMGSNLIQAVTNNTDVELTLALDKKGNDSIGKDAGNIAKIDLLNLAITDTLDANKFDVLIDFTRPAASLEYLEYCAENKKKIVLGTTGFTAQEIKTIQEKAQQIAVVFSSNYSIGVNLVFKLLEQATAILPNSDIEIIESHHNKKEDAPSGTALSMGKIISNTLDKNFNEIAVFERNGIIGARKKGEIGFSTIRAADIVGEHSVWFATQGERVEISHKATSRMTFANGAIRAACWLSNKSEGLFDMQNVLNFK